MMDSFSKLDFNLNPLLIFWETTKACDLACRHCRASALTDPLPDEMDLPQSLAFIESIVGFGKPKPILILTGGNMLMKKDLAEILGKAKELEIPVSASPSATDLLNQDAFMMLRKFGVVSMSLSLDGSKEESHDWLRGVSGSFAKTICLFGKAKDCGATVQVNTTVFSRNVMELPEILKILIRAGIKTWEVFFLIHTGRGIDREDLSPEEYEDVNHWLVFASRYGIRIRTVESPIFRRIAIEESTGGIYKGGKLYERLVENTLRILGPPGKKPDPHTVHTRDGKGIIFVAHNGDVTPSGFLPVPVGNVKNDSIVNIYRNSSILKSLRNPKNLKGKCGACEYSDICGGSRSRAYSYHGDFMASDPSCVYVPQMVSSSVTDRS